MPVAADTGVAGIGVGVEVADIGTGAGIGAVEAAVARKGSAARCCRTKGSAVGIHNF